MKFEKIIIPIQRILPPTLQNISISEYNTEIRLHPLLKWFWTAVCTPRADYKPYVVPADLLTDLMTPRIHAFSDPEPNTPKDPIYGHIRINDAVGFPNLWPWTDMIIVRITGDTEEAVFLKDIKLNQWIDAFQVSERFFQMHHTHNTTNPFFPTVNMNFLRPSASSVLHPHLQSLILPVAPPLMALIKQESRVFYEQNAQDFFTAYIDEEQKGPRWIGAIGSSNERVSFLTPWAPLAGSDEVLFVSRTRSAFPLSDQIWNNIAEGLHKIFIGYHEMGIRSINFVICSDLYDTQNDFYRVFGMVWSRPLKNLDISDRGFAEIGYKMILTFRAPEQVASDLRMHW